jgi:hypothetical protein
VPHPSPRQPSIPPRVLFLFTVAAVGSIPALAQPDATERQLREKKSFADRETQAVAQPFTGLATSQGITPGLFPVKSTGVSTAPLVEAAQAFLATLTPSQKLRTQFDVEDAEWRRWCNVDNGIYVRQGVSIKEMNGPQREAARNRLRVSLSAKGLALTDAIRKTDQTLREINGGDENYDEELYFFTVMGIPSPTKPWGWQIDGHHLVINTFVLGDQVVMTPTFLGGEPIHTTTGKYTDNVILQDEQNQGLALMQALDPAQRTAALLSPTKNKTDIQAEAFKDNAVIDYAGVAVSTFSPALKTKLRELIALFVNNEEAGHAKVKMEEIEAHLDQTWFAWVGGSSDDAVFYYRIHSPVILIEFDHQRPVGNTTIRERGQPTREHIHVVIRTPNGNDYGKDLLRQHLLEYHHQ